MLHRVDPVCATRLNNLEDGILHSHRRENLISYIVDIVSASINWKFTENDLTSYTIGTEIA